MNYQLVTMDKLIKYIKKQYGNFYTESQIRKIIEEYGSKYFKQLDIEYINYGLKKINL